MDKNLIDLSSFQLWLIHKRVKEINESELTKNYVATGDPRDFWQKNINEIQSSNQNEVSLFDLLNSEEHIFNPNFTIQTH